MASDDIANLKQEVDQLNAQFTDLMLENRGKQRIVQNENRALEMEIENVIQTFDNKMEELQTKMEMMTCQYEKEQAEMKELEGVYSDLEMEYNQIMERKKQSALRTKAAITIQTWWRNCCEERALKDAIKSTPKKKGQSKEEQVEHILSPTQPVMNV